MNKLWTKQNLTILSLIIFFILTLFLFFNHTDTLISNTPRDTSIYFHVKPKTLNKIPLKQKAFLLEYLSKNSSIKKDSWQKLIQENQDEMGFFVRDYKVFVITKNNQQQREKLQNLHISFTTKKNSLIFPELSNNTASLRSEEWFKSLKNKIVFSDFIIYVKNPAAFNKTLLPWQSELAFPFVATFKSKNNKLLFSIFSENQKNLTYKKENKPLITELPKETQLYFSNIDTQGILSLTSLVSNNNDLKFLQILPGKIEYLQLKDSSVFIIQKSEISLADLEKALIKSFSQLFPIEEEKKLIDGTKATNLVAKEALWSFQLIDGDNFIHGPEGQATNLLIKETPTHLIIYNNTSKEQRNNLKISTLQKTTKKGYLQINANNNTYYNTIKLKVKNTSKFTICID